ncbi:MAG: sulfite exporter TauE/SafE family protein [Spirochaetota bacterium]|nr:MAG: sulfite exporter TauE/SafE family protein [Spirochaetota bacterium]
MAGYFSNLLSTYFLGLLTPLTAACVLPLYPGYISFLARRLGNESGENQSSMALGGLVTVGVIVFMALIGAVFTTFLSVSLTKVISIVSPIAFGILALISVLLILNVDFGRLFPKVHVPETKNPFPQAFLFGFFFGAIVLPCNPGMIAAFFTKTVALSNLDFISNMLNFVLFGIGIATPLLVFSLLSQAVSQRIIRFLVQKSNLINRVAGILMLGVSLYYMIFVFRIFS